MKVFTKSFKKLCLMAVFALLGVSANATVYTALISGNFNSALTWVGGLAPGALLSTDAIIIPAGITVTLTNNQTFSGTSSLTVDGTLTAATGNALIITSGTLAGAGTINADSMVLGLTSGLTFTGNATAEELTSLGANLSTAANFTVTRLLTLSSGVMNVTGGGLTMGNMSTIMMAGGTLTGTAGMLHLTNNYDVVYTAATTTGAELSGSGLDSVTVNTTGAVTLAASQALNGVLTLTSGALALNGNTLTFNSGSNLSSAGSGTITGTVLSDIVVNTTGSLTGALRFTTGGNTLNNLTINTGGSGVTSLGSDLSLNGLLTLTAGTLAIGSNTLTLNSGGNLASSGTGTLTGSTLSNLVINATAGLTGALRFATGGNTLNNLTLNTGSANTTSLGSDLSVNGLLTLTSGTLGLNGRTLTFGSTGNLASAGSGMIGGNSLSSIVINATAGLTGTLRFATGGNMLNNLTLNSGAGSTTTLGNDLTADGLVTLTSGMLGLNGHTLTFNTVSDLAASGTGSIMGSAASNLVVNATAGLTGAIRFATSGNMLNNLTLNTGSGNTTALGSDLTVNGLMTLTSGVLGMNGHQLTFGTAGNLASAGTGTLMGSSTSSLVVNATSGLSGALRFATGGNMLNNLTINTGGSNNTMLGGDLTLNGMLTLTSGALALNGHELTLGSMGNVASSGSGTITGSALSDLTINTMSSITGALRFTTGGNMLHNLTVNMGSGSANVTLGSDLSVGGILDMESGRIMLGANDLSIATGGAVMGGSSSSYVATNGTGVFTMHLAAGTSDTFDVGTTSGYSPIVIAANSGSATGDVSVNTASGVWSGGTSGVMISTDQPVVNATWYVTSTATSGIDYTMTAMWSAGMEVNGFNRNQAYLSHYTSGAWDTQASTAAGVNGSLYTMTRTGITSLSPFMVADMNVVTTDVPAVAGNQNTISVYPNPVVNSLHFSANGTVAQAAIYDMSGRFVKSADIAGSAVNVQELPAGTYFIHFTGNDFDAVQKFVKQ